MKSSLSGAVCVRNILLSAVLISWGTANAALIDGSVEITGAFNPVDGSNNQVGLDVATGIDFTSDTGVVVASSGDLATAVFTLVTVSDFQFSPSLSPNPVTLWSYGGFSFDMNDVTLNSQSATNLSLSGSGMVFSGGVFDDTNGNWEFTANTVEGSTTFSWSSSTVAVIPVPPAVWLFGSGLLGMVGIARRKKAA